MLPLLELCCLFPSNLPVAMVMHYQAADAPRCGICAVLGRMGDHMHFCCLLVASLST